MKQEINLKNVVIQAHNAKYCITRKGSDYQVERYHNHEWELIQTTGELNTVLITLTEGFKVSALKSIENI